jgi:hypothetical protein
MERGLSNFSSWDCIDKLASFTPLEIGFPMGLNRSEIKITKESNNA